MLHEINLGAKYSIDTIQTRLGGDYNTTLEFLDMVQEYIPAGINYSPEQAQAFIEAEYVDSVEEIIDRAMDAAWERMIEEEK